jgi:uncharacterized damage-inducible protein DinB
VAKLSSQALSITEEKKKSMREANPSNDLPTNRRSFLKGSVALSAGLSGLLGISQSGLAQASDSGLNILGPKPGYAPQVGTLVSLLTWMREANGAISASKGLSQADLDYLLDAKANTIGALLLHLAATETYYQLNTFNGMKWGSWPDTAKQKWDPASQLGDLGRKTIKGHDLNYYLDALKETRAKSLAEFTKRDDAWLMAVDKDWPWGPTNNFCKWFHVCEHEAHHTGQIALLRKRLPGAKQDSESGM